MYISSHIDLSWVFFFLQKINLKANCCANLQILTFGMFKCRSNVQKSAFGCFHACILAHKAS